MEPCPLPVLVQVVSSSPRSVHQCVTLEHLMLPLAGKLYGDADLIFQHQLAPAHMAKKSTNTIYDHGITVRDWSANLLDLNPLWETPGQTMQTSKRPLSITPQQCQKLVASKLAAFLHPKNSPSHVKCKYAIVMSYCRPTFLLEIFFSCCF